MDIGRCRPMLFGKGTLVPEMLLTGRRGDEVSTVQSEQHTFNVTESGYSQRRQDVMSHCSKHRCALMTLQGHGLDTWERSISFESEVNTILSSQVA